MGEKVEEYDQLEKNTHDFPISELDKLCEERCSGLLKEVFEERRDFFIYEVKKYLLENQIVRRKENVKKWIRIESLSMLRAEVGGRFQNLKDRWINCGFPLKEHKGEQVTSCNINQEGWQEMRNWLYKQGYEARLAEEGIGALFEIAKIEE